MTEALIISANFYQDISNNLKKHTIEYLQGQKCTYKIVDVPGIFEIPGALSFFVKKQSFNMHIILGCVIRGETSHYDNITQEVFRAITDLSIKYGLALGMGIVTTENYEQAIVRSTGIENNSGLKSAKTALQMMNLYKNSSV